jgi:hypothetical protein
MVTLGIPPCGVRKILVSGGVLQGGARFPPPPAPILPPRVLLDPQAYLRSEMPGFGVQVRRLSPWGVGKILTYMWCTRHFKGGTLFSPRVQLDPGAFKKSEIPGFKVQA